MKFFSHDSKYSLNSETNTWSTKKYSGINYNDGDEIETRIADIIAQASDITVLSTELRQYCTDWPSLYHLSGTRANILRPFKKLLTGNILEIGSGCGAITRYLGECNANVLALEGSPRRAAITRSRTRDLENVTVVTEKFDEFKCDKKFDVITLIGVLEYANLFNEGINPPLFLLEKVRSFLKPDGRLIIAIENQLGLKYFAGAPEDHIGEPNYGIEGRYQKHQAQTFGKKVLTDLLNQAGYSYTEFFSPFPDYKFPTSIVSSEGFNNKQFDASAFAWQSVRRDPQLPVNCNFSQELVWPEIFKNGFGLEASNSFIVIGSETNQLPFEKNTLAYHYSTNRIPDYCKETKFVKIKNGSINVQYENFSIENELTKTRNTQKSVINFAPQKQDIYIFGTLLSQNLVRAVTKDYWTFEQIASFIKNYLSTVEVLSNFKGVRGNINSPYDKIPGEFIDLIPQNIVVDINGSENIIDKEWVYSEEFEVGFLLFRTFLSLFCTVSRFGKPASNNEVSYFQLIKNSMSAANIPINEKDLNRYIILEIDIQNTVIGLCLNSSAYDWLANPIPVLNTNQALKSCNGKIDELNAKVDELNAKVDELNAKVESSNKSMNEVNAEIYSILNSKSWRITKPLRILGRLLRKPGRKY